MSQWRQRLERDAAVRQRRLRLDGHHKRFGRGKNSQHLRGECSSAGIGEAGGTFLTLVELCFEPDKTYNLVLTVSTPSGWGN